MCRQTSTDWFLELVGDNELWSSPLASSCLVLLDCVTKLVFFGSREDLEVLCVEVEAEMKIWNTEEDAQLTQPARNVYYCNFKVHQRCPVKPVHITRGPGVFVLSIKHKSQFMSKDLESQRSSDLESHSVSDQRSWHDTQAFLRNGTQPDWIPVNTWNTGGQRGCVHHGNTWSLFLQQTFYIFKSQIIQSCRSENIQLIKVLRYKMI